MIILIQLKGEINKELGRETDAYISEAEGFARQRAEGGKFYLIQVSKINIKINKVFFFICLFLLIFNTTLKVKYCHIDFLNLKNLIIKS